MMATMNRRRFLRNVSIAGGGVVLGISLGGCSDEQPWPNLRDGVLQPNAFLRLDPDGGITLTIHKAEMGQGVMTGLATLVAEELEVDPGSLQFEFAQPHAAYVDGEYPIMVTGGSASMAANFIGMRVAGAAMREMLQQAAAQLWSVDVAQCLAREGRVATQDGSRSAAYGELALAAAQLPVPEAPALKQPAQWRLIGKHGSRVDALPKVDGSAQFAIDVQLPGMLTAVLLRCPHFGGALRSFNADAALALPGVQQVLELNGAVAVVADGYWHARRGAELVQVDWDKGRNGSLDSAAISAGQRRVLDNESGRVVAERGTAAVTPPARVIEAEYAVPYLAHATMEPLNAVASVSGDGAEIWAGNQAPDILRSLAARASGIARDNIVVHSTYLGGGFGRRIMLDFALEALLLSQRIGKPVKLVWSREDDTRHDFYRPAAMSRMRASIDGAGQLSGWDHRIVAPSIMGTMIPMITTAMLPLWVPQALMTPIGALVRGSDESSFEGASDLPYEVGHLRVEYLHWDPGVPVGVWRSVGHSQNAFFAESFADEIAAALDEDPFEFRMRRLAASSRHARVLALVAEQAGWGRAAPGMFQGIALHESFGTVVAEVVEVSMQATGPRVERVVCAVDCGIVVNPDVVRMQIESAVVFALSAALHGEITIAEGAVVQGNFDDYPILRLADCPAIEVHLLASDAPPSGIGEPGVPPLAPALANAIFAATGQRLRSLPLRLG